LSVGPIVWLRDGSGFLMSAADAAGSPRQIWYVSYPEGQARKISNDLHDYSSVSLTLENDAAAAVQTHTVSALWVRADAGQERLLVSEIGDHTGAEGFSWTPDGRIVYAAGSRGELNLWAVSMDGTGRRQLTVDAGNNFQPAVSPDGRYVVFASDRSGTLALWRMALDASHPIQLTQGRDEVRPAVSPDSRWVVYQQGHGWVKTTLAKVSIDGGDPVQLTTTMSLRPVVSPTGETIAYYSMDDVGWSLAVMSSDGGAPMKKYAIPATGSRVLRWTPDGLGLAYIDDRNDESNVHLQRLDGSAPEHLTSFHAGDVVAFEWSPDGRHLAYVRVTRSSDVVRLRGFRD
ncbi:MAG: TolB family protein, partial [Vicinamibacterales bacterium]